MNKAKRLRRFLTNPITKLVIGLVLLSASLVDVWDTLLEDIRDFNLKGSHGLVVFGFFHFLEALAELVERIEETREEGSVD